MLGGMSANSEDLAKRTPPGQSLTTKWPVLTYGLTPKFNPKTWTFRCFGLVEEEVSWTWEEFQALPRTEVFCDIHCVTRWSRLDNRFEGVHIREIMKRVRLKSEAKFVMIHADPDYTTNLPLGDLVDDDVVLALTHDGKEERIQVKLTKIGADTFTNAIFVEKDGALMPLVTVRYERRKE